MKQYGMERASLCEDATGIMTDAPDAEDKDSNPCTEYIRESCPLICTNLRLKLSDHLLLGGEHNKKISPEFNSPIRSRNRITADDKTRMVLADPKFGMFSLFKYHLRRGYKNQELKKSNKIYCSHIFSLAFALPILIFVSQWMLYLALMTHEVRTFDGDVCPNRRPLEDKLMMCAIGMLYFVRSFYLWDNLTTRIDLQKMNRVDNVAAILDTFQEFMFVLMVYGANLWIVFVEDEMRDMILNSVAMEFLMQLDNEFEELYFENLPGAAEDIYDTVFVTYEENRQLIQKRRIESRFFRCFSCTLMVPYKLLVVGIFCFPAFCFFVMIAGPICK